MDTRAIMCGLAALGAFIYVLISIRSGRRLLGYGQRYRRMGILAAAVVIGLFVVAAVYSRMRIPVGYLIIFVLLVVELRLLFPNEPEVLLWGALHLSVHLISVRGMVTAVVALVAGQSLYVSMQNDLFNVGSLVISMGVLLVMRLFVNGLVSRERLRDLLTEKRYVRTITVVGSLLFFYQLLCAEAFYYNLESRWFNILQIAGCVLLLSGYYMVVTRSSSAMELVSEVWKVYVLEEQLRKQLLHYRSYQEYSESIRVFRHDYEKMIGHVFTLVESGNKREALRLLEQLDWNMQDRVACHRQYSNNLLVDAAMQDLVNECDDLGIRCEASLYIPDWLAFTDLELCELFALLFGHAVHLCREESDGEARRMWVSGTIAEGWMTVSCEIYFTGSAARVLELLECGETAAVVYGQRLSVLRGMVEKRGGLVLLHVEEERQLVRISIHLCRSDGETRDTAKEGGA